MSRPTFAIISTWPDTRNAEFEVIERIIIAARNIGCDVYTIDNDGYIIATSSTEKRVIGQRIDELDCGFAISLHFESPRVHDVFQYITLWNPPSYFRVFGYEKTVQSLVSHDGVISCASDVSDMHAANAFLGYGKALLPPFPRLFHNVPQPYLEPNITASSRLFYIGINWERISGKRGRHQALLESLDEADLIDIFGPEEFLGARPWEGFKTYRGEIPFDGRSVLDELNKSGICLAFSSLDHQRSGIMSNRLFEGLAAGAVVIANPHPFIEKYFQDCVYTVDDRIEPELVARAVLNILADVRSNPSAALEKVRMGQKRLAENFSLEQSLRILVGESETARRDLVRSAGVAPKNVSVIFVLDRQSEADLQIGLDSIIRQTGVIVDLSVVCPAHAYSDIKERVEQYCGDNGDQRNLKSIQFFELPAEVAQGKVRGTLFDQILSNITSDYFCFIAGGELWFSDHIASLLSAFSRSETSLLAASGKIIEDIVAGGRARRRFQSLTFNFADLATLPDELDVGRFLFRRALISLLPRPLLGLIDGFEPQLLAFFGLLHAPPAGSNSASFVEIRSERPRYKAHKVSNELQRQMILDAIRGNPSLLARKNTLLQGADATTVKQMPVGRRLSTASGGPGLAFIREGFSGPEAHGSWIDGRSAYLAFLMPASDNPLRITLALQSRMTEGKECSIFVNDVMFVERRLIGAHTTPVSMVLPTIEAGSLVHLAIVVHEPAQVRNDAGKVTDPRYISVSLESIGLFAHEEMTLEPGVTYTFGTGGSGNAMMWSGFSEPETGFVWIDGVDAELRFRLKNSTTPREIRIGMAGRTAAESKPQKCDIWLNGEKVVNAMTLGSAPCEVIIPVQIGGVASGQATELAIRLAHAEPVRNQDGEIIDQRRLGAQIRSLSLFDVKPGEQAGEARSNVASLWSRIRKRLLDSR